MNRFFDFSVGSDYWGTLIRSDSQNQLQMVTDDQAKRDQTMRVSHAGTIKIQVLMRSNDVVFVTLRHSYTTDSNQ